MEKYLKEIIFYDEKEEEILLKLHYIINIVIQQNIHLIMMNLNYKLYILKILFKSKNNL